MWHVHDREFDQNALVISAALKLFLHKLFIYSGRNIRFSIQVSPNKIYKALIHIIINLCNENCKAYQLSQKKSAFEPMRYQITWSN